MTHYEFIFDVEQAMQSGTCPSNAANPIIDITSLPDPAVTAANYCGLVKKFYNNKNGNAGGDIFKLDNKIYRTEPCSKLHEDVHVVEFQELIDMEVVIVANMLEPMPIAAAPNCVEAAEMNRYYVNELVKDAYVRAETVWGTQGVKGETGRPWRAEFPCATNMAIAICQWAKDDPNINVDECRTCTRIVPTK